MVPVDRTSAHLVGDEESPKRRQILDGACKVFLDLGFDGASMGEIARAAGVSKGDVLRKPFEPAWSGLHQQAIRLEAICESFSQESASQCR
jgi:hypothetical protein